MSIRLEDLDLGALLSFEPRGGVLRFAGERTLLFDAVAMGLLRRELADTLGMTGARGVLTRLGYAHGWRTAKTLKTALPWASERDWRQAGGRLHTLQGMVVAEACENAPSRRPEPFAHSVWHDSYEAEQHLLQFGQADEPVCWTLAGFASGYLSYANGSDIYCVETKCRGRGDALCEVEGRFVAEWGEEHAEALSHYRKTRLDEALEDVTGRLRALESRLRAQAKQLRAHPDVDPSGLVAKSDGMRRVLSLARRVARVDSTVLVRGESGTGKERIARLIHDESPRAGGPFVAVNCGAISESLLESELFGHVRGAFTGALHDRVGLFEAANRGTLLLDEIGEVSPLMQVKLLRVLQEREVRRVGENRSRPIDVRIVAATHRDLGRAVQTAVFREDLYYRLRVVELFVPPLRERQEDILPLARELLSAAARRMQRPPVGLASEASHALLAWHWPGNVRELENAMERAAALASGNEAELRDLPEELARTPPRLTDSATAVRPLHVVEREHILGVLRAYSGHRAKAARALGIGEATLYRKLKAYGAPAAVDD